MVVVSYREKFDSLNRIDLFSLFVSLLTIMFEIMLESGGLSKEWYGMTLSIICAVLNISTFLVLLCFLFNYWVKSIKLSMSECGTHIDADAGTLKLLKIWLGYMFQSVAPYVRFDRHHDQKSLFSDV